MIARIPDKKNHSVKEWLNFILDKLNAMVELVGPITEKNYPKKTCPCWSIARIDLHSEHLNLPALVVLSRFEQTGQLKIFGKTLS